MKYIIFSLFFIQLNIFGQKSFNASIISINNNIYNNENNCTKIKYTYKNKYENSELEMYKLIHISNKKSITIIDSISTARYLYENNQFKYKLKDSNNYIPFKESNKKSNWEEWKYYGSLYYLNYLPVQNNMNIWGKKIKRKKLVVYNGGFLYSYFDKKNKVKSIFYFDENIRLKKIKYLYLSDYNIVDFISIEFESYNANIDSVAKKLEYGQYNKNKNPNLISKLKKVKLDSIYKNTFPLVDGTKVNSDTNKIEFYVLDFWFISCVPCHLFRNELEKIYTNNYTNIQFYGYNTRDNKESILNFNKKKLYKIPEIDAFSGKFKQYKISSFPTILIFDKNFNLIKTIEGYSKHNLNILKKIILI